MPWLSQPRKLAETESRHVADQKGAYHDAGPSGFDWVESGHRVRVEIVVG